MLHHFHVCQFVRLIVLVTHLISHDPDYHISNQLLELLYYFQRQCLKWGLSCRDHSCLSYYHSYILISAPLIGFLFISHTRPTIIGQLILKSSAHHVSIINSSPVLPSLILENQRIFFCQLSTAFAVFLN